MRRLKPIALLDLRHQVHCAAGAAPHTAPQAPLQTDRAGLSADPVQLSALTAFQKSTMLAGQTALVTGAAGDLGHAMAVHLAKSGASVVMWDIKTQAEAASLIAAVGACGTPVSYACVDVRDRAAVETALGAIPKLDVVCSNAGIVKAQPFLEIEQDDWQVSPWASEEVDHC